MRSAFVFAASLLMAASSHAGSPVEIYDSRAADLIDAHARITIHGEGYLWTEGPLWVDKGGYLLFSDIPNNVIHKYVPGEGVGPYLEPSGSTGLFDGDTLQGSNGLLLNAKGELVLLQHGDRRVAVMDAPLDDPAARFRTLVDRFDGKRLNSPNDGVFASDGSLYFTDPPYGLANSFEDPLKELVFQGIYRLGPNGDLELLDDTVKAPNGIGLSADEETLYVAVSEMANPRWLAYNINDDGIFSNRRVFFDANEASREHEGLPDGMVVHSDGTVFATGPGGVWVFSRDGDVLARILTGRKTANCTLSADEKTLYMTAHDTLMSIPLK